MAASTSPWDGHVVLLYSSPRERLVHLAAWIGRGLERGEKIVLTGTPDESHDGVLALCAQAGLDVDRARRAGQLLTLATSELAPRQDEIVSRAHGDGFCGVRVSAPAPSGLRHVSTEDLLAAERLLDRRCREGLLSAALCQFPRPAITGLFLRDLLTTHVGGVRSKQLSSIPTQRGVRVTGEIDLVNGDVLGAVLHAATTAVARSAASEGSRDLALDLSGLEFIDVAGCRLLLRETADFRRAGGSVLLIKPQRAVARALKLMEVDVARGVHLVDDGP